MAVRGIFAETEVGDDEQIWHSRLKGTNGLLHNAFFRVGVASYIVFVQEATRKAKLQECPAP